MTNDERDVLYHLERAPETANLNSLDWVLFHVGAAISLAILEVARAIRAHRDARG